MIKFPFLTLAFLLFNGLVFVSSKSTMKGYLHETIADEYKGKKSCPPHDSTGKSFSRRRIIKFLEDSKSVEDCMQECDKESYCGTYQFFKGFGYTEGCYLFMKYTYETCINITAGTAQKCPDIRHNLAKCTKINKSYTRKFKIILKQGMEGWGVKDCQRNCEYFSDGNGFRLNQIDWKWTEYDVRYHVNKNNLVECAYWNHYIDSFGGMCMIFTNRAKETDVINLAGEKKC